ncbi:9185_t:CDS:2 [Funneliformis mosseae]|uniref:9185_t:CDS:1 n=1 Tax=Funneliformis mosseae TaxID=27381 RepID=A0A9N9AD14_FUNMO|nr:9185_t:CDS:2 [Funneliformis mosseae]
MSESNDKEEASDDKKTSLLEELEDNTLEPVSNDEVNHIISNQILNDSQFYCNIIRFWQ